MKTRKVPVFQLTGEALNYAVAVADGRTDILVNFRASWGGQTYRGVWLGTEAGMKWRFNPCKNPRHAWPIIEREGIQLWTPRKGSSSIPVAVINYESGKSIILQGATVLEAAMRAFVEDRKGLEVDVPEEML